MSLQPPERRGWGYTGKVLRGVKNRQPQKRNFKDSQGNMQFALQASRKGWAWQQRGVSWKWGEERPGKNSAQNIPQETVWAR